MLNYAVLITILATLSCGSHTAERRTTKCRPAPHLTKYSRYDRVQGNDSPSYRIAVDSVGSVGWNVRITNLVDQELRVHWDRSYFVDSRKRKHILVDLDSCTLQSPSVISARSASQFKVMPGKFIPFSDAPVDIDDYLIGGEFNVSLERNGIADDWKGHVVSSVPFFCYNTSDALKRNCYRTRSECRSRLRLDGYASRCDERQEAYCTAAINDSDIACGQTEAHCNRLRLDLQTKGSVAYYPCELKTAYPAVTRPIVN